MSHQRKHVRHSKYGKRFDAGRKVGQLKVYMTVMPAEANGWRVDTYRKGQGDLVHTLDSKWFQTKEEAQRQFRRSRKNWFG